MKYFAYLLFGLLLAVSCKNGYKRKIIRTLKLNIGFNYIPKNSGDFIDKRDGKQYLYFGDLVTKKCIKIFDLNAKLKQSIFIQKEVYDYLQQIDGLSIISPDTIILNSLYTNKICLINRKGEIWHKITLQGKLYDSLGNAYEITKSTQKVDQKQDCFVFGLSYVYNINDTIEIKSEPEIEQLRKYYERSNNAAYFLKITNPFATPKLSFCLYGFYREIPDHDIAPVELENIYVANKQTFILSSYNPFIYQVDQINSNIESKYSISSDHTPLNFAPYKISESNSIGIQDYINQNARFRGMIYKLSEDSKGNMLVFVYHDIKTRMPYRPFSAILYNNKFEKIEEFPFEDGVYMGNSCISTENGFLLRKNNSKINTNEAFEFSLFKF